MSKKRNGFTLIELLVVISIIAILSVVGLVLFTNVQNKAKDSKKRADIDAISKAYEGNFATKNEYQPLTGTEFSGGIIPKPPEGGDYNCVVGPGCQSPDTQGFKICAALSGNPDPTCIVTSPTCYCKTSTQGTTASTGQLDTCDPGGALRTGLQGYWKMDEASWVTDCSTLTVVDSAGSNGGKSCPAGSGPTTTTGQFSSAGNFDGVNDYVDVGNPSLLQITGNITLSAWVKFTTSISNAAIISRFSHTGACAPANNGYILAIGGTGGNKAVFVVANGGIGTGAVDTQSINNGEWHHIVGTFDGTNSRIYVDGVLKNTVSAGVSSIGVPSLNVNIGRSQCYGPGAGGFFTGQLDDVRIYNRALNQSEISLLQTCPAP